jgi:serine/threonine protein kinase
MVPQLNITSGPDNGRVFPLILGETLQVGRSQATATRLTDPTVSRVHCEIEWDGKRALVINISSSGTYINGQTVAQQELRPGDVMRVGNTELALRFPNDQEASTVVGGEKTVPQPGPPVAPKPIGVEPAVCTLLGKTLSHYVLEQVIAKGAAGVVFKAKDTNNDQPIALKVLEPEYVRHEEEMQRFIRAMKTMLPLRHPNLIPLLKAGKTGSFCWVAMEWIEGESLTQVIKRVGVAGMLDWRYGFRVAVHIARALDYAHSQSIIHRNVTPQNIMWRTADKTALLGDLMLAKALEGTMVQQITKPGELVGDVGYMSPERTRGTGEVDCRSDLYGLGATVYALIAGRPPFGSGTMIDVVTRIRNTEPEKPRKYQMAIPDMFQGTVMRLLAKRPDERFQTAKDLLSDLERVGKFAGVTV